jgi:DNA gyrase subunit A
VKKTALDEFSNPRKAGIIAVDLDDGDHLIGAALTNGTNEVMLFSDGGKAVRFREDDVRAMGRQARGVRGCSFGDEQRVISLIIADDNNLILTATELGMGKRSAVSEFPLHNRGGSGVIAHRVTDRTGAVVASTIVNSGGEIMLITDKGVLVRTRVDEISVLGRATQGVKLIGLDDGAKLSGLQRIAENDAESEAEGEAPEGDAGADGAGGGAQPQA